MHILRALTNAVLASLHIGIVASILYYGPEATREREDTVLVPIALLSLFVLSASVMGYLFVYDPLRFYLDGEKKRAVNMFLATVAFFGIITVGLLLIMFSGAADAFFPAADR